MRGQITEDGTLELWPETDVETYAFKCWEKESYSDEKASVSTKKFIMYLYNREKRKGPFDKIKKIMGYGNDTIEPYTFWPKKWKITFHNSACWFAGIVVGTIAGMLMTFWMIGKLLGL